MRFVLILALLIASPAFAEHVTHGTEEPSPRLSDSIVSLLLSKAGNIIPGPMDSGQTQPERPVVEFFSSAVTSGQLDIFGSSHTSTVAAHCLYIGAAGASDRDERCFVTVTDESLQQVVFHFVYSPMTHFVQDVVIRLP